jgi:lysozyme
MDVIEWIKRCEGFSSKPYKDSVGVLTIGYGTNLDQGITVKQADSLLRDEIDYCLGQLKQCDWYIIQPNGVQNALLNMCYNLGITRLCSFKKMIGYLKVKDYANASHEALDSQWALQVGHRAKDIAIMIGEGK